MKGHLWLAGRLFLLMGLVALCVSCTSARHTREMEELRTELRTKSDAYDTLVARMKEGEEKETATPANSCRKAFTVMKERLTAHDGSMSAAELDVLFAQCAREYAGTYIPEKKAMPSSDGRAHEAWVMGWTDPPNISWYPESPGWYAYLGVDVADGKVEFAMYEDVLINAFHAEMLQAKKE